MTKPRRDKASFPLGDTLFAIKQRKAVRREFVLDVIAPLSPETRSMFGCLAVYDASSFEIGSKSARPRKRVVDVSIRAVRSFSRVRSDLNLRRSILCAFSYSGALMRLIEHHKYKKWSVRSRICLRNRASE
jgi:hypothetical protein